MKISVLLCIHVENIEEGTACGGGVKLWANYAKIGNC